LWFEDFKTLASQPLSFEPGQAAAFLGLLGLAAANDSSVRAQIQLYRTSTRDSFFEAVTFFGSSPAAAAITGSLALAGEEEVAYKMANSVLYAGIGFSLLKTVVGRPRPYTGEVKNRPLSFSRDYASFPSGHTATAFAMARVLAEEYPDYKYFYYAGAALVGLSRIYLDVHYASDVVAGAALGLYAGSHVEANSHLFEIRF
ncbi:MAG: phosphatase PAP2 family protein, partial [Firmicutes bacterium]|nr:phosphatase PAP2 family protein [Bacillota bacterium]